jgi:hypothetical protein
MDTYPVCVNRAQRAARLSDDLVERGRCFRIRDNVVVSIGN